MFRFVLRKAASVNHSISIMSPDYRYLPFLSTAYYSLTSWVYHRDHYLLPEGGQEFFHPPVERGGVMFMPALSKTPFLKQGTGTETDKDACQSRVHISAHGS